MDKELEMYKTIASLIFPDQFLTYFDVIAVDKLESKNRFDEGEIVFRFEEKDALRNKEEGHEYRPNGFYEASSIRDFPLRDKKVTLEVKRRRWVDVTTGKSISNTYDLVANGTRHSKEFADFLKETIGHIPDSGFFA